MTTLFWGGARRNVPVVYRILTCDRQLLHYSSTTITVDHFGNHNPGITRDSRTAFTSFSRFVASPRRCNFGVFDHFRPLWVHCGQTWGLHHPKTCCEVPSAQSMSETKMRMIAKHIGGVCLARIRVSRIFFVVPAMGLAHILTVIRGFWARNSPRTPQMRPGRLH